MTTSMEPSPLQPCDDALEVLCGPCRPDEDWPAVHLRGLYADRSQRRLACAEGCGRVAYWLVAVPCYRSLLAGPVAFRVTRATVRLVHHRRLGPVDPAAHWPCDHKPLSALDARTTCPVCPPVPR